jgi:hypothetical protein
MRKSIATGLSSACNQDRIGSGGVPSMDGMSSRRDE